MVCPGFMSLKIISGSADHAIWLDRDQATIEALNMDPL